MRFFTALTAFGLLAFAAAQNATTTEKTSLISPASTSAVAASTASLSAQVRCLQSCGSADVCCQAKCVGVPCPSQLQANATTECAAACPQGNGSAIDTQQYADCQASCISSNFLTASATAAPTSQTGGSSASTTGTFAFGSSVATTTGGSASATGASASASATGSSGNGADSLHLGSVGLGFLALVMAGMAL